MRNRMLVIVALALSAAVCFAEPPASGDLLAHNVYFSLKDNSEPAQAKLVAACERYLKGHEGEVFFVAGTRSAASNRDVNDRDFDVSLHIFFKTRGDHDRYQDHPRHKQFIKENQANWAKVRVFDSEVK
ncbi:MAG TPA: Dabb family protein [Bryobacteraceae bacterium]|nr:Dabb family protein [Bryobacteraceae bacterium]